MNTVQPNLMLALSPAGETARYASAWFAWTQLFYSLSVLAGGYLYDWLEIHFEEFEIGDLDIDHFALLFLASWVLKSLTVFWASRIPEPSR